MGGRTASRALLLATASVFTIFAASCSINRFAVRTVAGFLAGSGQGTVFTGDDDPELVGDALPFALKTYESLLEADPSNAPLALATGRAFVSYAFAFVQAPADELPVEQVDEQQRDASAGQEAVPPRPATISCAGWRSAILASPPRWTGTGAQAALRLVTQGRCGLPLLGGGGLAGGLQRRPLRFRADRHRPPRGGAAAAGGGLGRCLRGRRRARDLHLVLRLGPRGPRGKRAEGAAELRPCGEPVERACARGPTSPWHRA